MAHPSLHNILMSSPALLGGREIKIQTDTLINVLPAANSVTTTPTASMQHSVPSAEKPTRSKTAFSSHRLNLSILTLQMPVKVATN